MWKASGFALILMCSCVVDVHSDDGAHGSDPDSGSCEIGIVYCDGLVDCPPAPPCGVWWCHQLQADDPARGQAWGTCRLAPVPDGMPCDGGNGMCDNRECDTRGDDPL